MWFESYKPIVPIIYCMTHHIQPNDMDQLPYNFVKISIDKSNRDSTIPFNFVSICQETCQRTIGIHDGFDEPNLEMRQHVRDNLINNEFSFVDPNDVDSVFITQKAIDEYSDY